MSASVLLTVLTVARKGCADDFILTVETGPIGGITSQGIAFGADVNTRVILDMTSQFDFITVVVWMFVI